MALQVRIPEKPYRVLNSRYKKSVFETNLGISELLLIRDRDYGLNLVGISNYVFPPIFMRLLSFL